jgi:hypothetical protein
MRKILAGTFVLALLAVALAGPPIDYELTCGEDGELIGVLSLTEGKVHVALVEDAKCDVTLVVKGPDDAPAISVAVNWDAEPPTAMAAVDEVDVEVVDLIVVPEVAIDGMLTAQRLRTAAMEMRREAAERGETDRDRDRSSPGTTNAPSDGVPARRRAARRRSRWPARRRAARRRNRRGARQASLSVGPTEKHPIPGGRVRRPPDRRWATARMVAP